MRDLNRHQARQTATGLLVVAAGFQASLAAGAPWGVAAYGGGHPGVLPTSLRVTSATAAVVYSGLAHVVRSGRLAAPVQRRAYGVLSGVFAVGTVMNAISPSMVEKVIWTPVVGLLAYSLWRARPGRDGGAAGAASAVTAGISGAE